jgi:polyferredoxin
VIRFVIDGILLLALSVAGWFRDPFLGVVFLGMSLSYASQYWRMIHLVGWEEKTPERRRIVMAVVLALIFGAGGFLLVGLSTPPRDSTPLLQLWREDFIPVWIGMGFFSALGLIYLANERRKR